MQSDRITFVSPAEMSPEQRRAAMAEANARFAKVFARVAADPKQSRATRDAAKRDLAGAQRIARKLTS